MAWDEFYGTGEYSFAPHIQAVAAYSTTRLTLHHGIVITWTITLI